MLQFSKQTVNPTIKGKGYRLISIDDTSVGVLLGLFQLKQESKTHGLDIPLLQLYVKHETRRNRGSDLDLRSKAKTLLGINNALAALEAIDVDVAEEVMMVGCVTGDMINGLVDGVSGTCNVGSRAMLHTPP
ncbi:hypothetical protein FF1_027328 [Malus domestica]